MLEKLEEAKEQAQKLDAKADSLVAKAIDVLTKVKESNWTWFAVGAAATVFVLVVLF